MPKPRTPQPHELERMRTCTKCGKTKQWVDFSPDRRAEDGTVLRTKSVCRGCAAKSQKASRRRMNDGRRRQNGRERVPASWEWIRITRCCKCLEEKPWALFSPVWYWPDGQVRRVQTRCRTCRVEDQRGHPRKITPERTAYLNDWKRKQRDAKRLERVGYGGRLPVAPFVAWLERVEAEEGGLSRLATDAGLHPDTLAKVATRNKVVAEKTAEAALCARGLMLADVYGYDFEEAA